MKDEQGKWLEARVIEVNFFEIFRKKKNFLHLKKINPSEIKVHFYNYSNKFDVWLEKNSGFYINKFAFLNLF